MNTNMLEITPTQSENKLINLKPLLLVKQQTCEHSIKKLKHQKYKNFTLIDSAHHFKKFHKSVLGESGRFNKLQTILEEASEYKLWFEVNPKVLDSLESIVYQDDDENSQIAFENIFDLFKIAVALEDVDILNKIIIYLTLDSKTLIETFTTSVSKEFLVKVSFDFMLFLINGKKNNLFGSLQLYQDAFNLINELFKNIFTSFFLDDNFNLLLEIVDNNIKNNTSKESTDFNQILEIYQDLVLKQFIFSVNQKLKFLEFITGYNNFENDLERKINYVKSKINKYIFNDNNFDVKHLNDYETNLTMFDIKEDNEVSLFKNQVIILQGYSKIVELENKIKEMYLCNENKLIENDKVITKYKTLFQEVTEEKETLIKKHNTTLEELKVEKDSLIKNYKTNLNELIPMFELTNEIYFKLSKDEYSFLISCMPEEYKNFRISSLIYKATKDGFSSKDFHFKVFGISNLLIFITSENGNKFGVFTPLSFTGIGNYKEDCSMMTFIFSLDKRTKFTLKKEFYQYAVYDDIIYGPRFGGNISGMVSNADILIYDNSNENLFSYTDLLSSFENSSLNIKYGSEEARTYLAGSYNFRTVEIEVFQIIR